jgi:hypothetical protein
VEEVNALLIFRIYLPCVEDVHGVYNFRFSIARLYNNLLAVWFKEHVYHVSTRSIEIDIVSLVKQIVNCEGGDKEYRVCKNSSK